MIFGQTKRETVRRRARLGGRGAARSRRRTRDGGARRSRRRWRPVVVVRRQGARGVAGDGRRRRDGRGGARRVAGRLHRANGAAAAGHFDQSVAIHGLATRTLEPMTFDAARLALTIDAVHRTERAHHRMPSRAVQVVPSSNVARIVNLANIYSISLLFVHIFLALKTAWIRLTAVSITSKTSTLISRPGPTRKEFLVNSKMKKEYRLRTIIHRRREKSVYQ